MIVISALIIKIGSISLRMTGIDRETAAFQAMSAYTGTGFTTSEAENIVNHPQRRRIVKSLMILGNVGVVSVLALLFLSFREATFSRALTNLGVIGLIAVALLAFPLGKGIDRLLDSIIARRLSRHTQFSPGAFSQIIKLTSGYGIAELYVRKSDHLAGKTLAASGLSESDILVLAIRRGFQMIPTPKAPQEIRVGDRLVCFGHLRNISEAFRNHEESETGQ